MSQSLSTHLSSPHLSSPPSMDLYSKGDIAYRHGNNDTASRMSILTGAKVPQANSQPLMAMPPFADSDCRSNAMHHAPSFASKMLNFHHHQRQNSFDQLSLANLAALSTNNDKYIISDPSLRTSLNSTLMQSMNPASSHAPPPRLTMGIDAILPSSYHSQLTDVPFRNTNRSSAFDIHNKLADLEQTSYDNPFFRPVHLYPVRGDDNVVPNHTDSRSSSSSAASSYTSHAPPQLDHGSATYLPGTVSPSHNLLDISQSFMSNGANKSSSRLNQSSVALTLSSPYAPLTSIDIQSRHNRRHFGHRLEADTVWRPY